ncbi:hypothetical protein CCACVL1_30035 [Corchorus capsularis]|uniref:Uncharacterized protein n=1 Tax=Corchorus capsularis TaxID=210143 RepID=A0A1R3FZ23_COCAP|nr:hypothetical protein CCACVL1_30035 [Corchorus capsularis]
MSASGSNGSSYQISHPSQGPSIENLLSNIQDLDFLLMKMATWSRNFKSLNFSVVDAWRPWMVDGQAAGKASLWKIKPIVTNIHNLLGLIHTAEIRVIKRSANSAADWFARQARPKMSYVELGQHQPSSIVGIWSRDGVGAPP